MGRIKPEKTRYIILISILSIFGSLISGAFANDRDSQSEPFSCADSISVMDCIERTQPHPKPMQYEATTVNGLQWANSGPLSLDIRYDNVLGWIPQASYTQISYGNGINLQLGYGANEQRANITLGHSFNTNQQVKITYEYLSQNLPFDFASGSVNEWVSQNAFGAAYRYLLFSPVLHSINLNGYYIHANNKDLNDVIFYQNDNAYLNLRHIAGGTEETATTGITLYPFHQLLINLGGGYSHLVYDTEYEDNQDTATLAYNAGLDFLINSYTQLSAEVTNSAAETSSSIKISHVWPAHIELALTGQYSQGQAGQPDSSNINLGLSYPVMPYALATEDKLGELKAWIQKPVVHAVRVLAIKDEKIMQYSIQAVNPAPQSIQTGQVIQEIHTQDIFNFDPALFDKVEYSLTLASNSTHFTSPQNQLYIDVKPDNGSVYNSIIYSTAPMPNSATPNGDATTYHVIVTALGYKNGLADPLKAEADLELNVQFNINNEPQWNPNKTTGAIAFDQSGAPSSINLNSYLNSTANPAGVKFALVGTYSNWDLKTNSDGIWYLVRKTDSNGAFNAGDISTTPQSVTLIVKYADDPDVAPGAQQKLNITVNPDSQITFLWSEDLSCQINGGSALPAAQPNNNSDYPLPLLACTQYEDSHGNIIKVANDIIKYSIKTNNYPNNVNINNNTLIVDGPTSGMGNTYNLGLNVISAAQGNANGLVLNTHNFSVDNLLNLNAGTNISTVTSSFIAGPSLYITSVVINSLDISKTYQLIAASNTTNMMECTGAITTADAYNSCNPQLISLYQNLPYKPNSQGQVSIMWWSSSGNPAINSLILATK